VLSTAKDNYQQYVFITSLLGGMSENHRTPQDTPQDTPQETAGHHRTPQDTPQNTPQDTGMK